MIKPTVGRKVWYRPSEGDLVGPLPMTMAGNPRYNPQPLDATILAVWGDRCVNVLVFDIMGKPFTKAAVTLLQEGDKPACDIDGSPVYGYVEWMPFQQAQAAKIEQPASA